MFARVRLTLADTGDTVVVPEQSVAMGRRANHVQVVDGRAMRKVGLASVAMARSKLSKALVVATLS